MNLKGTLAFIHLATEMKNLKSVVHVSTIFSNCINAIIAEDILAPALDYKKLINLSESLSNDILADITPR